MLSRIKSVLSWLPSIALCGLGLALVAPVILLALAALFVVLAIAFGVLVLAAVPVLLVAAGVRLWPGEGLRMTEMDGTPVDFWGIVRDAVRKQAAEPRPGADPRFARGRVRES